MPISKHYSGSGNKVAREMRKLYGKDWKKVFYASEKKLGRNNPGDLEKHDALEIEECALLATFHVAQLREKLENEGNEEYLELADSADDAVDSLLEIIDGLELNIDSNEFEDNHDEG